MPEKRSRLQLFLLGTVRLAVDGRPVEAASQESIALLAYLAVTGQAADPEFLAGLIWPGLAPAHAQASLRRSLWHLRRGPLGRFLSDDSSPIQLDYDANVWVDAVELERQLAAWEEPADPEFGREQASQLREITTLYRGEFLAELRFADGSPFEEWATAQRRRLRNGLSAASQRLVDFYLQSGDVEAAESLARQRLAMERPRDAARPMPVFLFSDIENSTPLWDRHREGMLLALRQHNALLAENIERFGGRILESRGDGVKALFEGGQPLEAVLAIQKAFASADWGEVGDLRIRLGLHGVPVEWEGYDYFRDGDEFFGPVLNYASRVMDAAWGGQIMVSENIKDTFELPPDASLIAFGQHELKGCAEPIALFGLIHPDLPLRSFPPPRTLTTARVAEETAPALPLLPEAGEEEAVAPGFVFVARERELGRLERALQRARSGQGELMLVTGGPGRGKTALLEEFSRRAQHSDPRLVVVRGNCNAHTGAGNPYLPFREALMMLAGDVDAQSAGERIETSQARRLWELMPVTLPTLVEVAPELIGSFIPEQALRARAATFASTDEPWFKQLGAIADAPQRANLQQRQVFSRYASFLRAMTRQRPLLLLLEDLHWVDTSSVDLLFHLERELASSAILIVGTYRPEEVSPGRGRQPHPLGDAITELKRRRGDIWIDLGRLAEEEGRSFVNAYVETEPNRLSSSFREALYRHTGGHALFTAELLRDMQERGDLRRDAEGYWTAAPTIDWRVFPARVEGVIERRIGRLPDELQAVLRVASVEGESFTAEVVARVEGMDERQLISRLGRELDKQHRLVAAQALERVGSQRLSRYRFRHQLFQHYLYHSLDEMERAYLHEEIGRELEALHGKQNERIAVPLAHHFEQAGLTEKAISYLQLSGISATRQSANMEAIRHVKRGLELLSSLPPGAERHHQELALQVSLGVALQTTSGLAAPEVEKVYTRARELCQLIGDTPQLFPVLWGLWLYYSVRAVHQTADELGQQLWALASQEQEPTLLLLAHRALGSSLFWAGEFVAAGEHFRPVMEGYRPEIHHSLAASYGGSDIKVVCLYFNSLLTAWLGYPEQALEYSHESLRLARVLSHTYSLVAASMFAGWLRVSLRDWPAAGEFGQATMKLAAEHGAQFWLSGGRVFWGSALAATGSLEEGIAQIRQGLDGYQATGGGVFQPFAKAQLAEFLGRAGQPEEGLAVLDEALATLEETEERCWEADLHRLRGELLLIQGTEEDEAAARFEQAIAVAVRQQAKLLELRATVSLARLLRAQGRTAEARQRLEAIAGWFSQGFDTADHREARLMLDALSA